MTCVGRPGRTGEAGSGSLCCVRAAHRGITMLVLKGSYSITRCDVGVAIQNTPHGHVKKEGVSTYGWTNVPVGYSLLQGWVKKFHWGQHKTFPNAFEGIGNCFMP